MQRATTIHNSALAVVEQLRSYATRGVFREFAVQKLSPRQVQFHIVWLTTAPIRAKYDAKSNLFTLIDLLPGIKPRSSMDRELRTFISGRFSSQLPEHRRLSRALIRKLVCVNARRCVSLRLTFNPKKPDLSARQAIHLISEIFQNFLAGPYHEYMVKNFDLRED